MTGAGSGSEAGTEAGVNDLRTGVAAAVLCLPVARFFEACSTLAAARAGNFLFRSILANTTSHRRTGFCETNNAPS